MHELIIPLLRNKALYYNMLDPYTTVILILPWNIWNIVNIQLDVKFVINFFNYCLRATLN